MGGSPPHFKFQTGSPFGRVLSHVKHARIQHIPRERDQALVELLTALLQHFRAQLRKQQLVCGKGG